MYATPTAISSNWRKTCASHDNEVGSKQMQVLRWHVTDQQLQAFKLALLAAGSPQRTEIIDAIDLSLYREILRSRGLTD
jgi:hypothetical protein